MRTERRVGVRWTLGSVAPEGFEALRLAVWGGWKAFGPDAAYTICVNSLPLAEARERVGDLPEGVKWREATGELPAFLRSAVDEGMAEGKAWKFDPLRAYPDRWEISLDNDCILWEVPGSIRAWLDGGDPERCLIAADVAACHGAFARWTGEEPRNAGIRGIPPGFDLEGVLRELLREIPVVMTSELDEQGLQVAAVSVRRPPVVVSVQEVSICSPFPPPPAPGAVRRPLRGAERPLAPLELLRPPRDGVRPGALAEAPGGALRAGGGRRAGGALTGARNNSDAGGL